MSFEHDLFTRQYAVTPTETVDGGWRRVADHVARAELRHGDADNMRESKPRERMWAERFYSLMRRKAFIPGGRVLAGAGTKHGNMLNCFVQDGSPLPDGSTEYALNLAKRLALVTKVGGGNGLCLDAFPARTPYFGQNGNLYLTITDTHKNHAMVRDGTYMNLVTGEYVTRPYRRGIFIEYDHALEMKQAQWVTVQDNVEGIWDAATKMVGWLMSGDDVVVDLSKLRAEGAEVKGSGGSSSGPSSFVVEIFDNFAYWAGMGGGEHAGPVATLRYVFASTLRVIRQGGSRRGAGMATLSVTHPDIDDFITSKDLQREELEGDIGTFNISVLVPDDFMRTALNHARGKPDVGPDANIQLATIAHHAWQTGEPGIIFVDTINRHNPLAGTDGPIKATNP